MKKDKKEQAKLLRQNGYSFREISKLTDIPRSTVRDWCYQEIITDDGKLRLEKLSDDGRLRSIETIKRKQKIILDDIDQNCTVLKNKKYNQDDYKLFLVLLYWAEGAKTSRRVDFINSDPEMIKLYLWLFRKSFVINEDKFRVRLHLHNYHNQEEMVVFWSEITAIPKNNFSIYNKPHTGINKKPGYKGCLSIRYGDSRIIKEIFLIMKRLENLPNIAGLVQW